MVHKSVTGEHINQKVPLAAVIEYSRGAPFIKTCRQVLRQLFGMANHCQTIFKREDVGKKFLEKKLERFCISGLSKFLDGWVMYMQQAMLLLELRFVTVFDPA